MDKKKNALLDLAPQWTALFQKEFEESYMKNLFSFLKREKSAGKTIYPPREWVFNAFKQTPFDRVSVVIVGQDPYHGPGQAHGLSFSVQKGIPSPPSLKNIFKELQSDLNVPLPKHGCLLSWARQGVLLLNATLTVELGKPRSHYGKGWEFFTDAVVKSLVDREDPVIFVLWGKNAQEKCLHLEKFTSRKKRFVLTSSHPSPYSAHAGFLGSKHFSRINELLLEQGKAPIDWELR